MTKQQLKVVLIDDEERSRTILQKMIEDYIENATVMATGGDVLEGIKIIQQHQPDVVFLDIEMPNYSGFKLVEHFNELHPEGERSFEIVFTTAYEKYAVKAYKAAAFGYLLKPIDIDDLIDVFEKISKRKESEVASEKARDSNLEKGKQRVIFPTQSGIIYLTAEEISCLESSNRYTDIYLTNNEKLLTTLSLKDCFEKLEHSTFIRIHRSYIINLSHIQKYSRGRDSYVILDNGRKIDVGLYYKEDLNSAIASFLK